LLPLVVAVVLLQAFRPQTPVAQMAHLVAVALWPVQVVLVLPQPDQTAALALPQALTVAGVVVVLVR
jgi:hypothetical protein